MHCPPSIKEPPEPQQSNRLLYQFSALCVLCYCYYAPQKWCTEEQQLDTGNKMALLPLLLTAAVLCMHCPSQVEGVIPECADTNGITG